MFESTIGRLHMHLPLHQRLSVLNGFTFAMPHNVTTCQQASQQRPSSATSTVASTSRCRCCRPGPPASTACVPRRPSSPSASPSAARPQLAPTRSTRTVTAAPCVPAQVCEIRTMGETGASFPGMHCLY